MTQVQRTALWLLVGTLAAGSAGASRIPEESKKRAARIQGWELALASARTAAAEGRVAEAESLYREVREQATLPGGGGMHAARATDALADLYRVQERMEQAAPLYAEAAKMWERLLGGSQPRLAVTLHNLGVVYAELGDLEAAERTFERALAIWETSLGADSAEAANTRRAREAARTRHAGL